MTKKLNLGCGNLKKEGYINIDSNPQFKPDTLLDVRNLSQFPNDSVDEIFARDVLEHISHLETEKTLREWYRVLKKGGILNIQVPNLMTLAEELVNPETTTEKRFDLIRRIFGGQNYSGNFHNNGFCDDTIIEILRKAGFDNMHLKAKNDYETPDYPYNMTISCEK